MASTTDGLLIPYLCQTGIAALEPLVTIVGQGMTAGSHEVREMAAETFGEIALYSSEAALKP